MTPNVEAATARCLGCASVDHVVLHVLPAYRLLRCRVCTLVWIDPVPPASTLLALADEGHSGQAFADMERYFDAPALDDAHDPRVVALRAVLARLGAWTGGRTLLDVGCGTGCFAALAERAGWHATAIDAAPAATAHARTRYGLAAITTVFPDPDVIRGRFSAVTLLDVLEHVPDPRAVVARVRTLLEPGGIVLIESPNHASLLCRVIDGVGRLPLAPIRRRLAQYYHRAHVSVFSPRALRRLLGDAGFAIVAEGQTSPLVGRFDLPIALTFAVRAVEGAARALGMQSRCWVAARIPADR